MSDADAVRQWLPRLDTSLPPAWSNVEARAAHAALDRLAEAAMRLAIIEQESGEQHDADSDRQLIRELRMANQSLVARIHELETAGGAL